MHTERSGESRPETARLGFLEEIHQILSEGIADAIEDAADNLQFSRNLLNLAQAYDQELESIERELRSLESRIQRLLTAMQQAAALGNAGERNWNRSDESLGMLRFRPARSTENQAA